MDSMLSKEFKANFYTVEKQLEMLRYAIKNFSINNIKVNTFLGDFIKYNPEVKFDFIISNPPFYKVDKNQSINNSINIARYEHHLPLENLIQKVSKIVKNRGYFIFCYDAWQIDDILKNLQKYKIKAETIRFIHPKADKEAKVVMIIARKNSKARCKVLPALVTFDNNGEYTKEAKEAFKIANTHSCKAVYSDD